jgi:S1-C subfamily serine protease
MLRRILYWTAAAAIVVSTAAVSPVSAGDDATLAAITKIRVTASEPDPLSPWQRTPANLWGGSGAIIDGHRIITNAHVVAHAIDIQVSRHGDPTRYPARTVFVDHERDLALLTVDDARFFAGIEPLDIAATPARRTRVQVLGYPIGGESLSVTEGILSRFEIDDYAHSLRDNLVAQLDAPINAGNSGGPVISEGKLIGLAMQTLGDAENIGYCIPTAVIEQFFADIEDGQIDGPPWLGVRTQQLHPDALRKSLGMPAGKTGVLISSVVYGSTACGKLQPGDVLLEIDGHPIANDETVDVARIGRVNMVYLLRARQVGDQLPVTFWRAGSRQQLDLTLKNSQLLVSGPRYRELMPYVICGGFIFTSFDIDYLYLFEQPPLNLLGLAFDWNEPSAERREAVVLVRVLPHPVNQGYQEFEDVIVVTAMGETVRDLAHLQELLTSVDDEWITITFDDHSRVVMSTRAVQAADKEIGRRYGIGHMMVSQHD